MFWWLTSDFSPRLQPDRWQANTPRSETGLTRAKGIEPPVLTFGSNRNCTRRRNHHPQFHLLSPVTALDEFQQRQAKRNPIEPPVPNQTVRLIGDTPTRRASLQHHLPLE